MQDFSLDWGVSMIRVLVVEDEPPILRSICIKIPEINPSFEVVDTACNGREAIEKLTARNDIDVAVVDINLPVLNGIAVLECIKENHPNILSVVLSGYKDYEYVRAAFGNNTVDYLLKPLKDEQLRAALEKIKATHTENNFHNDTDILGRALRGVTRQDEELYSQQYYMLFITAGADEHAYPGRDLLSGEAFAQIPWDDLFHSYFEHQNYWLFDGKSNVEKIVLFSGDYAECRQTIGELLLELGESRLPITVAINRGLLRVNMIYEAYRNLRTFANNNAIFLRTSLQVYNGNPQELTLVTRNQENKIVDDAIIFCKKSPQANVIASELMRLVESFISQPVKQPAAEYIVKRFLSTLCSALPCHYEYVEIEERIEYILRNYWDMSELQAELHFLVTDCFGNQRLDNLDKKELAAQIRQYLDSNYHFSISNKMLSEQFGFVSSYLSSIFKEHCGLPPSEYIIQLRIEEAKKLLCESDLKIKDISLAVGYSDPLYFSRVFKKVVGKSPREYSASDL